MRPDLPLVAATAQPFLVHYPESDGPAQRVVCHRFPFRLGRDEGVEHVIYSRQVSKEHAAILRGGDGYSIRDLGSTNGTFVNGTRVGVVPLRDGDIIHIAHKEFLFGLLAPRREAEECHTAPVQKGLPLSVIYGREVLHEVLRDQHVRVVFQPIVQLNTGSTVAYEALGRGTHSDLSASPMELFRLAEKCGLATKLSGLFRRVATREADRLTGPSLFFLNAHPAEMDDLDLIGSLAEAAPAFRGERGLVLEVHENAVADVPAMRRLREQLNALGVGLAYDDFGAGQSRLNELAEAPPDFLKLDMKLIRGIHEAPARQDLVHALCDVSRRLGTCVIAEGLETAHEADCCRRLGCHWGQGFLFAQPLPAAMLPTPRRPDTACVDVRPVLERLRQLRA